MSNIEKFFSMKVLLLLIAIFFVNSNISFSQGNDLKPPVPYLEQFDLKDMLKDIFSKKKKTIDSSALNPKKDLRITVLPGAAYNPATSVVIGVSANASWYYGDPSNTVNSSISTGVSYTTKNQLKISLQSNIYTNKNDWLIAGDWRFWKYVQDTYGLGTNTQESIGQNMDFNFIRLNQNILKKIGDNMYAGIGYDLEYYTNISTEDNTNDSIIYPSFNSIYSKQNGFDTASYLSSGLMATAYFDSRDNTINPFKGYVFTVQYRNFNEIFGSSSNYQSLNFQIQNYHSFNKKDNLILASRLMGSVILNGRVPYMVLNSIGWDKYNTTGRGYVQGRFRGRDFMYLEIESRITITKNRFFGIALFANAETMSNPETGENLLDYIKPAAGIGLRFLYDKYSRTNICIDYGRGVDGSSGIWFNLGEYF